MAKIVFPIRTNCELCQQTSLLDYKISKFTKASLRPENFTVTNKEYSTCVETVKCQNCELIQPKYLLTYSEIVKLYSDVKDVNYLSTSLNRGYSNFKQILSIIKKLDLNNKKISILEIGSGSGGLLKYLKEHFPLSEGIEPSKSFCAYAKKNYDLNIHNTSYESFEPATKYDLVIALDIIEHIASPSDFLKKTKKYLKKRGILIIGTPNIDSFTAKIFSKNWWHIRPPHIFYFTNKTLELITKRTGFRVYDRSSFYWSLSLGYILDSVQKIVFRKSFFNTSFLNRIILSVNPLDSIIFVLKRD